MVAQASTQPVEVAPPTLRRVALSSMIGTAAEWYDYFIYGTAAALVFPQLFFPTSDPATGTLLSFATFAVTFFMRPVGALVFGHFGDRLGRKTVLIYSIVVIGVGTFAIGLLPSYDSIGLWAPVLLIVLRMFQGFAVGGEYGGAATLTMEYAPDNRRGFWTAWSATGLSLGLLLGTIVPYTVRAISPDSFASWGWRVPFWFSLPLVLLGLYIRLKITDTPAFKQMKQDDGAVKVPVVEIFKKYKVSLLLVLLLPTGLNMVFYIVSSWSISYITGTLELSVSAALVPLMIAAFVDFAVQPLFGLLSDIYGRKPIYLAGSVWLGLTAFPFFWLVDTGNPLLITVAFLLVIPIGHGSTYAVQATFFAELFGTNVRYSGLSIGYHLGAALTSGPGPLIAAALLTATGTYWPIAAVMVFAAVVSVVTIFFASETYKIKTAIGMPPIAETTVDSPVVTKSAAGSTA